MFTRAKHVIIALSLVLTLGAIAATSAANARPSWCGSYGDYRDWTGNCCPHCQ
jgi:hypothetical protein